MKKNIKTKKQIEKEIQKLREEQNKIEEIEFQKTQVPFLKSLLGKCFIYKDNGYGGDETWDMYRKVVDIYTNKDGVLYLISENISMDCFGKITLEIDYHYPYTNEAWRLKIPFTGYEFISETEYQNAKTKLIAEMSSFTKMKKYLNKK